MGRGERRLAAILVADVVGYSRMMADDEGGTLAALNAHRAAADPVILNHGGRIVKSTGDGVLVEFTSAVSAVHAAVNVQELMARRNAEVAESRRMQFRIGINLGDVIADPSGDIFGDGVNIAARIEPLADPGGISVTNAVYETVKGKATVDFRDDGERRLKNIPTPVRVWKVGSPTSHAGSATRRGAPTFATVAVLPFDTMSGDEDQEYFADGITEDLITALAYDRELAVVARNSAFAFKGTTKDVRTVARELDATHVVEGSVRRSGTRIRVNAQLIDAETGHHVWANRFDRDLTDLFAVQDELVEAITAGLRPTFAEAAGRSRAKLDGRAFDAWDLTVRGQFHVNRLSVEEMLQGIELFDRARELEPEFVPPIALSGWTWITLAYFGWRRDDVDPWDRGRMDAEMAHRLDPNNYLGLGSIAALMTYQRRPREGVEYGRRMTELNPYAPLGFLMLGQNLDKIGEHEQAIAELTQAWRLGRNDPLRLAIANDLAYSHYMAGTYEAAITWARESLRANPRYLQAHLVAAASHGQLDGAEHARPHVEAVLEIRPDFSCVRHRSRLVYDHEADKDHFIAGLRKAGLPA